MIYRFHSLEWFKENAYEEDDIFWRYKSDYTENQRQIQHNEGHLQYANNYYIYKKWVDLLPMHSTKMRDLVSGHTIGWAVHELKQKDYPEYYL